MAKLYGITGVVVTPGLAERTVEAWRLRHKKVVRFWYALEDAVRKAIASPGKTLRAGDFLQVRCQKDAHCGLMFLMLRLPSGRVIAYPKPRIKDNGDIIYYGQIPMTQKWGDVGLYGGKCAENACQGISADIMAHGAWKACRKGYKVFALIHDQALAEGEGAVNGYVEALTDLPAWAQGLPIEAEGQLTPYYTK